MKLTAEQRLERCHVQLMQHRDFCLFSGVFMVGKVTVNDKVRTASTNGRDVVYGRAFVDSLNDKELAFLVVHEAMHKSYRHMSVWRNLAKENPLLANMAMDYVINLEIRDTDPSQIIVAMPRDADGNLMGCLDERFRGMDTKQVYDILKEECEGDDGDEGEDGGGGGQPSDENGHGHGHNDNQSGSRGELDEHDWDGAGELTGDEKEELEREIDSALREGSILAGKMKGNVSRGIFDLLHPKVDWKQAMRDFVKVAIRGGDESTWRRPNRRMLASNLIMPNTESRKAKTIAIGIDTSGSIGGELLSMFMSEFNAICEEVSPECVELLYWDSHVAKHETYRDAEVANAVKSTKPAGGGGTQPECVPAYLIENRIEPQCVVMLTDGYFYGDGCGNWSGIDAPVLWCVKGNAQFSPTVGQCVHIE